MGNFILGCDADKLSYIHEHYMPPSVHIILTRAQYTRHSGETHTAASSFLREDLRQLNRVSRNKLKEQLPRSALGLSYNNVIPVNPISKGF